MKRPTFWTVVVASLLLTACQAPRADLSLVATVGISEDVCADDAELTLFAGETHTVYYCYTITNVGDAPLYVHDVFDDLNGAILRDFEYRLDPGASVDTVAAGLTLDAEIDATTTNTGRWDGFASGRRLASAEASATVTLVPPRAYGAVAGTFVGDGNADSVDAYAGNLVLVAVRELDGTPLSEPLVVQITPPGAATFDFTFDPATALDGVVALILDDFAPGAATAAARAVARLGLAVAIVPVERDAGPNTSATLGGDFVFAFPGATMTRTVDAEAALTVPAVDEVTRNVTGDVLTIAFAADPDPAVGYQVEAYGRGTNAHVGFTVGAASPIEVMLTGPLDPSERIGVDIVAVRGVLTPDAVFAAPVQFDVAEYLYLSPAEAE